MEDRMYRNSMSDEFKNAVGRKESLNNNFHFLLRFLRHMRRDFLRFRSARKKDYACGSVLKNTCICLKNFLKKIGTYYSRVPKLFFTRFGHHDHGSSMIEFAIILPLFISLVFGTLQLGVMMVALNAIDAAAREASRFGITGTILSGLSRSASITQVIQTTIYNYSGGILSPGNVDITEESFPNIAALEANPIGTLNSFGTGGQVVRYTIQYNWDTIFPIFGNSSIIPLKAEAVVVNENFS